MISGQKISVAPDGITDAAIVFINGVATPYDAGSTAEHISLLKLVRQQGVGSEATAGIAVAVNEQVIPRSKWPEYTVQPGDRVEIIHALMGG